MSFDLIGHTQDILPSWYAFSGFNPEQCTDNLSKPCTNLPLQVISSTSRDKQCTRTSQATE